MLRKKFLTPFCASKFPCACSARSVVYSCPAFCRIWMIARIAPFERNTPLDAHIRNQKRKVAINVLGALQLYRMWRLWTVNRNIWKMCSCSNYNCSLLVLYFVGLWSNKNDLQFRRHLFISNAIQITVYNIQETTNYLRYMIIRYKVLMFVLS
jgi:hypothetical protein